MISSILHKICERYVVDIAKVFSRLLKQQPTSGCTNLQVFKHTFWISLAIQLLSLSPNELFFINNGSFVSACTESEDMDNIDA